MWGIGLTLKTRAEMKTGQVGLRGHGRREANCSRKRVCLQKADLSKTKCDGQITDRTYLRKGDITEHEQRWKYNKLTTGANAGQDADQGRGCLYDWAYYSKEGEYKERVWGLMKRGTEQLLIAVILTLELLILILRILTEQLSTMSSQSYLATPEGSGSIQEAALPGASFLAYKAVMPLPGTPGAPHFDGTNVTEFLERYEEICDDHRLGTVERLKRLP